MPAFLCVPCGHSMEPDKKRTFTPKQRESFWEESKASAPGGAVVCGECCNVIHTRELH